MSNSENKYLYCMLKDILKGQGLRQIDIENATGIRPQTIVELYHNKYKCVTTNVMQNICITLKIQPGDLFSLDPQKKYTRKRPVTPDMVLSCNLDKYLNQYIAKKGSSIPKFAKKTQIRENTIRNILSGKALRIQKMDVYKICKELNISFGQLYTLAPPLENS